MIFIYLQKLLLRTLVLILILELNWDVNCLSELSNLPLKSDVNVYLRSLERILEFCANHKNDIDLNLEFGIFLLDVNLKHFMTRRETILPLDLRTRINKILRANELLSEFFRSMVNNVTDPDHEMNKNITSLFSDVKSWVNNTKKYNTVLVREGKTHPLTLVQKYSSWDMYMDHVTDYYKSHPSPKESDECMYSLSKTPIKKQPGPSLKCFTSENCSEIVLKGSRYGYALTHRTLYLLAGRYGRNCYTFRPTVDDALIDELCATIYEEAQYIAFNGYKHADLIMEQICLCTLPGHAAFLQRRWLSSLLQLQSSNGCFKQDHSPSPQSASVEAITTKPWTISKKDTQIIGNHCNGHVTAVAAAMLGAAVRYIIETYY